MTASWRKVVGSRARRVRQARGLSQHEVAAVMCFERNTSHQSRISMLERGQDHSLRLADVHRLEVALGLVEGTLSMDVPGTDVGLEAVVDRLGLRDSVAELVLAAQIHRRPTPSAQTGS